MIPLPPRWQEHVRTAVLHVLSLAAFVRTSTRGSVAANGTPERQRAAEAERLDAEVAMLREELRIKDSRMREVDPQRRPHYPPADRLAILELRGMLDKRERSRVHGG